MEEANEYSIFICDCLYVRSVAVGSMINIQIRDSESGRKTLRTFYIRSLRIDGAAAVTEQPPYGRSKSVILMEDKSPPPPPPGLV